jgi:hypothetical protein
MERPVNRCQSTISTANPNAVKVETPRGHPSRCTTGVNSESAAIAMIALSTRSRRPTAATMASKAVSKASCSARASNRWLRSTAHVCPSRPARRSRRSLDGEAVSRSCAVPTSDRPDNPRGPAPDPAPPPGRGWESSPPQPARDGAAGPDVQHHGQVDLDPITGRALQFRRGGDPAIDTRPRATPAPTRTPSGWPHT